MASLPDLQSERVRLRRFELSDAPTVERLAGDRAVAATTLHIPHPYPAGAAEEWISGGHAGIEDGTSFAFAVTRKADGALLGGITLGLRPAHHKAELAYWFGRPYWNQGYGTEAARLVLDWGFAALQLNRIWAAAFVSNPGSWRIMQKLGMQPEGVQRQDLIKWGQYVDVALYGILRAEWEGAGRKA